MPAATTIPNVPAAVERRAIHRGSTSARVQAARPPDLEAVVGLLDRLFPGDPTRPGDEALAAMARSAEEYLAVAHVGTRVAGFVLLQDRALRPWTSCAFLGVDPLDRGRGLGGALMGHALATARRPLFRLCVRASNESARRIYEAHGLKAWARRPGNYADGEDALVMMRWVGRDRGMNRFSAAA